MYDTLLLQVNSTMLSADEEGVGEHAAGARDKIKTASEAALADMEKAAERCACVSTFLFTQKAHDS